MGMSMGLCSLNPKRDRQRAKVVVRKAVNGNMHDRKIERRFPEVEGYTKAYERKGGGKNGGRE